jgi:aldehyde:ferredoxin oxidoreductase
MFAGSTGIALSGDEARRIGERIITLERLFNLREGLTGVELDVLPQRMVSEPSPTLHGGARTLTKEKLDGMLREYYALRRWDPKSGVPLRETLERLGLGFAAEDVIRAG